MTDKHKKASEIARLVGVIQDLAKDIEQDATSVLVYKDKAVHLSEIRDGAYAIVDYVKELEKLVGERGRIVTELKRCPLEELIEAWNRRVGEVAERRKLISDINNSINEMSNEKLIFVSDLLKRLIRLDEIAKDEK